MKLLYPSANIIELNVDIYQHIESIARVCYKSEDKITSTSSITFVENLFKRGHHAMLEFYPFYFIIDRREAERIAYLNQLPEIDGDFKYFDRDLNIVEASCNLRTALMIHKYNMTLGNAICTSFPKLINLFSAFISNTGLCELVSEKSISMELQYATVKFITNRGVTHELVRHRKCSFAQESTRYCNYNKKEIVFIIPTHLKEIEYNSLTNWANGYYDNDGPNDKTFLWLKSIKVASDCYNNLIKKNQSPQEARGILPNDLKTEIVVQARLSEWKHIFKLRCANSAHPDIREIMIPIRDEFINKYPNYFTDESI